MVSEIPELGRMGNRVVDDGEGGTAECHVAHTDRKRRRSVAVGKR